MPQTRELPEAEERQPGVYTNEQLTRMVDTIMGPTTAVEHPTLAPTARAGAEDVLQMWRLVGLLEGERPAEGTAERTLYDHAVRVLSEDSGRVEDARAVLHMAIGDSITRLSERMEDQSSVGDLADPLREAVFTIQQRANSLENDEYLRYRPRAISEAIVNIVQMIGVGSTRVGLASTDTRAPGAFAAGTAELPVFEMPVRDLGRVHLLSTGGELPYLAAGGQVTDEIRSLFGGNETHSQDAVDALANAFAMKANHEPQSMGCNELLDALQHIQHPQMVNNSHFQAAMEYLRAGNRDAALDELLALTDTPLNALLVGANQIEVVRISQRALSVYHAGVTMRFDFGGNMDAFTRYLRTEDERDFEPRLLYFGLGLYYDMLLISGWRQPGTLNLETGDVEASGQRTRITGIGHVATTTLSVGVGSSIAGEPVEWIVHCNFGYRNIQMDDLEATTQYGETMSLPEDQRVRHEPYIGLWGLEVRLPGRGSRRPIARIMPATMGVGFVGRPDNVLGYVTWQQNPVQTGGFTLQFNETIQIAYLLRQLYLTGEVNTRLIQQWRNGMALMGGPGVRVDVRGMDIEDAPTTASIEVYGELGYRPLPWLTISARGGYFMERGGPEWNRIPDNYFIGGNVAMDFGQVGGRIPLDSVPTRIESPIQEPVRSDYLFTVRWAQENAGTEALTGEEGRERATNLARLLDRQASTDAWDFAGGEEFTGALERLRAGNLSEGLEQLRRIPAFQTVEGQLGPAPPVRTESREEEGGGE